MSRIPLLAYLGRALPVLPALLVASTAFAAPPTALQCPALLEGHRALATGSVEVYAGEPQPNQSVAPTSEGNVALGHSNFWEWPLIGMPAGNTVVLCRYEGTNKGIRLNLTPDVKVCEQDLKAHTFACR